MSYPAPWPRDERGHFFMVAGLSRGLEKIPVMQYDCAGLIQIAPGRSEPGEKLKLNESLRTVQAEQGGSGRRL